MRCVQYLVLIAAAVPSIVFAAERKIDRIPILNSSSKNQVLVMRRGDQTYRFEVCDLPVAEIKTNQELMGRLGSISTPCNKINDALFERGDQDLANELDQAFRARAETNAKKDFQNDVHNNLAPATVISSIGALLAAWPTFCVGAVGLGFADGMTLREVPGIAWALVAMEVLFVGLDVYFVRQWMNGPPVILDLKLKEISPAFEEISDSIFDQIVTSLKEATQDIYDLHHMS